MTHSITGIDHCVILVRELDAARDAIARLGFTPAPRGVHSEHMGTHNHCVMLGHGYFEVLSVLKPTAENARWREVLARREGLNAIALATEDARAGHAELRANGVEVGEPVDFARAVDNPGAKGEASFTVALIPEQFTPGTNMFMCQHYTRDLVWFPGSTEHANGAMGLAGVTAVADDPAALAEDYARVFGAERVRAEEGALTIEAGEAPIRFLTPEGLAARYPGAALDAAPPPYVAALTIAVADREATGAYLSGQGVAHTALPGGGLCVAPGQACGALIEFV
jgi:catechol 2,3-dioxygenase-like lactoylglutathione lyase family enzyme